MLEPDRLIGAFDQALRIAFGVIRPQRASPADDMQDAAALEAKEREEAAALMRVNHAGEVCAQALYQGQAMATRNERLKAALNQASQEELDHLAWSRQRITELGGRTSVLNPLWYGGSLAMGYAAGVLGDQLSLGFLAETERQVEQHLERHLARLPPQDVRTRALIEAMARDESGHAEMARSLGAAALPEVVKSAMKLASRVMTTLSYRI